MAPKILLADDSMTAQNMGKKILAEGGYDVVTVSNGAAALKKIAELHPELVILDVYMPGYSGLEVCERIRGALETTNLPVMLTVGKLEPFKPEEGSRVKADGLLVKPFEATDLLAAVKKLLERGAATAQPVVHEDTVKVEPPPAAGVAAASREAGNAAIPPEYEKTQKIEVPQEMAVVPAMTEVVEAVSAPPAEPPTSMAAVAGAGVEAFPVEPATPELADTSIPVFEPDLHLEQTTAQPEPPAPTPAEPESTAPPSVESMLDALMPELELNLPTPAPEAVAPAPEIEFTAAPQAQDVGAVPLPDLEPTVLQDSIPVEMASDAALVTSPEELAQFTTKFGVDHPEETPVGVVADLPAEQAAAITGPQPEPAAKAPTFEESAASILEELMETAPAAGPAPGVAEVPANEVEVLPEPVLQPVTPQPETVPMGGLEPFAEASVLETGAPVEPVPAVERVAARQTEILPQARTRKPEPNEIDAASRPEAPAMPKQVPTQTSAPEQAFSLEAELQRTFADVPAARPENDDSFAAPRSHRAAAPVGEDKITELVERLIERLKPELVAAIVKELKG